MSESDNHRRWDGSTPGHYEVWYLTCNHLDSHTGYWIRYTLEAPYEGHGEPYAQLWFARFDARDPSRTFAINEKHPIAHLRSTTQATGGPFRLSIGEATFTHDGMRGAIAGAGHEARWDLAWVPSAETHHHLPDIMYARGGLGETTVLSPSLSVPVTGTITADGVTVELDAEPGGQTHLWGKKHAHAWAWGHCNAFEDRPDAALETLTVQLRRRGYTLPPLTIFTLYLDGEVHRFNQFRHTLLTRGSFESTRYRFSGRNARVCVEAEYSCRPEDMVVAPYVDPDGAPSWCSNTEVADLRVTVFERVGLTRWREREQLLAPKTGHFEIGRRERDPSIPKDHITI